MLNAQHFLKYFNKFQHEKKIKTSENEKNAFCLFKNNRLLALIFKHEESLNFLMIKINYQSAEKQPPLEGM